MKRVKVIDVDSDAYLSSDYSLTVLLDDGTLVGFRWIGGPGCWRRGSILLHRIGYEVDDQDWPGYIPLILAQTGPGGEKMLYDCDRIAMKRGLPLVEVIG